MAGENYLPYSTAWGLLNAQVSKYVQMQLTVFATSEGMKNADERTNPIISIQSFQAKATLRVNNPYFTGLGFTLIKDHQRNAPPFASHPGCLWVCRSGAELCSALAW